ncbi:MAG: sulfurtransferase [Pseudomonadota bacterium]
MSLRKVLLASILGLGVVLPPEARNAQAGTPAAEYANPGLVVETDQLEAMLADPDVRVVDVRPAEAYAEGHIPNAVHLGADDVNDPYAHMAGIRLPDAEIAAMLGERGIDNNTKVVLYDDQGGFHAARLFWMLEYFGHQDVAVLNGGIPKWQAEGREVTAEGAAVEPTTFALNLSPRKEASADWLLAHELDPRVVVIDVRPGKMYDDGHIPWANSLPWKQNLADDGTLKSPADLVAHFTAAGVTPDKNIAIHCQTGKASAHSYWALRAAGYPRLRVYDRSWAEWGQADDLPKATKS